MIHANSPQAKGRVERLFRTLQDRLVKEMRLAGISSVRRANEYLKTYLPAFNRKFRVKPASEINVHQAALSKRELKKIFCIREERTLRNDFTIAFNGKLYQIKDAVKAQKVAVEERLDGSLNISHKGIELRYREIKSRAVKEQVKMPIVYERKYQPADHPWKRLRRASQQLPVAS